LKYVKAKKVQASADLLPVKSNSYDLVFSSEMIEHLPEEIFVNAIAEIKRISKKYVFLTFPNDENIENVSLNGNELVFNTSSNLYSYECGGNLNEDENSDINDIYNGEALTGDTIGKSNFNNGTYLLSTPYNEVYPLYITDGVGANPYFTFNYDLLNNEYIIKDFNGDYIIVGYNLYLDLLTDFDYFDNQVIMSSTSTAGPFSYGQNGMLIYDFSNPIPYFVKAEYDYNGSTWLIENSITSICPLKNNQ